MEFSKLKITSKEFIGRSKELEIITNLIKNADKGIGNLLLLSGEAGVGKTRLISEVVNRIDDVEIHYLHGCCKYHQGIDPYSPFIEALRNWFGISETTVETTRNLKDKIGQHIRSVSPELISIIPLIRGFLSAGTPLYGSYLFKGSDVEKCFRAYKELVSEKKCGLFITRLHPDDIMEQYELENTEIHWLTKSTTDVSSFDPAQIEKLRWTIKDFVAGHKNCVVLLDGLEYLILQNNFDNVLKFVELLKDDIALNDAVLLLPIDPATLEERQMALLERYMRVILSSKNDYAFTKRLPEQLGQSIKECFEKDHPFDSMDMDYEAEKDKMFEAILQLIKNISSKRTMILFLDDLHWADFSSIQLLQYLFQNIIKNRVLIIGSYRPEDIPEGNDYIKHLIENINRLQLEERLVKIDLGRLNNNETLKVVKDILDADVPNNFLSMVYNKSEGNPLYIEEIIKTLLDNKIIDRDNKEWYSKFSLKSVEIPNSISEDIKMRIERVSKGHELIDQILKYTSILGSTFNFDVLLETMKIDEELLLDNIENLMKANIIHEVDDDKYKFDHTFIREVIYNDLGSRRKKILHTKIGYSIESLYESDLQEHYAELALHFSNGGIVEKAVKYSIKQGEISKDLCAYDEALLHYKSALKMLLSERSTLTDREQLINLYINLGDLSLVLGAWNEAKEYFEKSLKISKESGDDVKKVESRSKLGQIEIKRKRWSMAINKLEELLNLKLDDKKRSMLLVAIKPKYIMRANISLVKILLKEDLKGIYICINHPSYMIERLFKTHKIPTQNIIYLDFITSITGQPVETIDNAYIIDKAFSLERLLDIIDIEPEKNGKYNDLDFKSVDFIMVDNVSNLVPYTTQEKIEGFIKELLDAIKRLTVVYGIVLIDSQTNPTIRENIQKYFDNAVSIKEEWL